MELPPLRGTIKQVSWAFLIRAKTYSNRTNYSSAVQVYIECVDDATWWIANRSNDSQLLYAPKAPGANQCVGGKLPSLEGDEPVPARLATHTGEYTGVAQRDLSRAGQDGDENDEPHDAELFAESVSRHPALAEIAVLGLMAKLYNKGANKKVGEVLTHRARCQLDGLREHLIQAIDKDIDGLRRILK